MKTPRSFGPFGASVHGEVVSYMFCSCKRIRSGLWLESDRDCDGGGVLPANFSDSERPDA